MFLSWKIYILENISHFLGSGKLHNMCNFRYVKEMQGRRKQFCTGPAK